MKLWTIQPIEVYELLQQNGSYSPDPSQIPLLEYFTTPYDWMCSHLESKSSKPNHISYPVWAWARIDGIEGKKPDLRLSGYAERGTELVLLELEVPEESVLLSCFDCWHFPLNNWWLKKAMFGSDYTYEEDEALDKWLESLSKDKQRRLKEKSWEAIFNIGEPFENEWVRKDFDIQAVFWEMKIEHVKSIRFFKAK